MQTVCTRSIRPCLLHPHRAWEQEVPLTQVHVHREKPERYRHTHSREWNHCCSQITRPTSKMMERGRQCFSFEPFLINTVELNNIHRTCINKHIKLWTTNKRQLLTSSSSTEWLAASPDRMIMVTLNAKYSVSTLYRIFLLLIPGKGRYKISYEDLTTGNWRWCPSFQSIHLVQTNTCQKDNGSCPATEKMTVYSPTNHLAARRQRQKTAFLTNLSKISCCVGIFYS